MHIPKELSDDDFKTAFNLLQAMQREGFLLEQFTLSYYDMAIQIFEEEILFITNEKDLAKFLKTYEGVW